MAWRLLTKADLLFQEYISMKDQWMVCSKGFALSKHYFRNPPPSSKTCRKSELWKSKAGVLVCKDRVGLRIDLATGQNWYIKGKGPSPPPPASLPKKIDTINNDPSLPLELMGGACWEWFWGATKGRSVTIIRTRLTTHNCNWHSHTSTLGQWHDLLSQQACVLSFLMTPCLWPSVTQLWTLCFDSMVLFFGSHITCIVTSNLHPSIHCSRKQSLWFQL